MSTRRALLLAAVFAAGLCRAQPASAAEPDWRTAGDTAAALLSELIRFESVNPPGDEEPIARALGAWLEARGVETQVILSAPGRGNLIAVLPATTAEPAGPPLLLLSHLDVVPADPEAWPFPPFSGVIRDGQVFGRGAIDDKGHTAVFAVALALLAGDDAARSRGLVFAATAGEEVDGSGAAYLIENHWNQLGPPWAVWNEGGGASRVSLLDGRLVNGIATAEKRALWVTLSVEGEGGHGSQPLSDAAINQLVRALDRIDRWETPLRITATVGEQFRRLATHSDIPLRWVLPRLENPLMLQLARGALTSDPLTNAMVRDTLSLTGLSAGLKHNVIPRRAEAMLDIRLLPDTDAEAFVSELSAVIDDPRIHIDPVAGAMPGTVEASPHDHPLFAAIEVEMTRELPQSVTVPLLTAGSTDSLFFRERGVPAFGFLPAVLTPELNRGVHGVGERVPLGELERATRVTWRVLRRLLGAAASD